MALGHELRRRLWSLGIDVARLDAASHPIARRRQLLAASAIDVVLDVGANVGDWSRELRQDVGFAGRIRSFEPRSVAFEELRKRAARDPRWDVFNFALGDEDCAETIHISANRYSSSILSMLPAHEDAAPESRFVASESVRVRTLDSIFGDVCEPGSRVYLKVDTQGYEGRVLSGAARSLSEIEVVQLEMSLVPLYAGELTYIELTELMRGHGLELVALEAGFTDPRTGSVLQVDGVFRRPR